jgi:hypothetical protein
MSDNIIDTLFDENNRENIILYGENEEAVEFEQIAVVPYEEGTYAILKPVLPPEDSDIMEEDEALVFELLEDEESAFLEIVEDEEIINFVFEEYYKMLENE